MAEQKQSMRIVCHIENYRNNKNRKEIYKMTERLRAYEKLAECKGMPNQRVYICSPLSGRVEHNICRAKIYARFAYDKGYVPICPHIYYPLFLDDDDKMERAAGLKYGLEAMHQAKELWVFGKTISSGMRAEIELAEDMDIPIRYFYKDMQENEEYSKQKISITALMEE